jgi:DNA-binding NarL/FixJ family response regulator
MSAPRPRVVIVDDHAGFRCAARELFTERGWDVVAEASCGEGALSAVTASAPDLVLVDVGLGAESGLNATRDLVRVFPALAVLMVSAEDSPDAVDLATASGASGFVIKRRLPLVDLSAYVRRLGSAG